MLAPIAKAPRRIGAAVKTGGKGKKAAIRMGATGATLYIASIRGCVTFVGQMTAAQRTGERQRMRLRQSLYTTSRKVFVRESTLIAKGVSRKQGGSAKSGGKGKNTAVLLFPFLRRGKYYRLGVTLGRTRGTR